MIGRIAKIKYKDTEYEDEPLARRIELVLDSIFQLVGYMRRDVPPGDESESESDDDY